MAVNRITRRIAQAMVAALVLVAALLPAATAANAADPILPRPAATVRFLEGITFSGVADVGGQVHRLEIVVDIEGFAPSVVADVGPARLDGQVALGYVLATPGGSIVPNTDVTAHFRATMNDGTRVDGPSVTVHYDDTRFEWQVLEGDLVTVHWVQGPAAFGRSAHRIAEDAVRGVSDLLGVSESEPIDFFVYPDLASFYDVLGAAARENVGGTAEPEVRTLFAKIEPDRLNDSWVGIVIPHELTHLVFASALHNPYHDPPHWLDEGIAVDLSEGYGSGDRNLVETAVASGALMPLRALVGQFPTAEEKWRLAYAESVSAVNFLVRRFGEGAMVDLVRAYAGGVTDDEAFRSALGMDVASFEAIWLDDLGAPEPSPYGPVEAPPGPVPPDWAGDAPIPGEIPGSPSTPVPVATAPSGGQVDSPGGRDGPIGLLAGLVVLGLGIAGFGVRRARRDRPEVHGPPDAPPADSPPADGPSPDEPASPDPAAQAEPTPGERGP